MAQKITLGAGCFWCVETMYMRVKGVQSAVSGYMGGKTLNPTYEQVCRGDTGHAEVVQVTYDPSAIKTDEVLDYFWRVHDPTTLNRQGNDEGTQYRSAIFYHTEEQRQIAEKSKAAAQAHFKDPIVTEITPASTFYPAEEYHRDYYNRNPSQGYCRYVIRPKLEKLGMQ